MQKVDADPLTQRLLGKMDRSLSSPSPPVLWSRGPAADAGPVSPRPLSRD